MKSSTYYFHLKRKIQADFQICLSVPLSYVISKMLFNWIPMVIYNILSYNIPSHISHIGTYAYTFYQFLLFQAEANEGRLPYVYPCVSLIIQVFVSCNSFFYNITKTRSIMFHATRFRRSKVPYRKTSTIVLQK